MRIGLTLGIIAAAVVSAACTPAAVEQVEQVEQPSAAPLPSERHLEAYGDCTWGEVKAAGLSIWSYACPTERLVADEALPGFQREVRDPATGQVTLTPAVRVVSKAPDAGVETILQAVRRLSPGAEACVIEPGSHGDFVLMPTGAAFEAHQRFIRGEADGPSMPCGPLGPLEAGGVTFRAVEGAPDKAVVIDWGTSLPVFDPDTLRAAK